MTTPQTRRAAEFAAGLQRRQSLFQLFISEIAISEYEPDSNPDIARREGTALTTGESCLYRLCVERTCCYHERRQCSHWATVADVSGFVSEPGHEGQYTSPYFVEDPYLREHAWDLWQATAEFQLERRTLSLYGTQQTAYAEEVDLKVPRELATAPQALHTWAGEHADLWHEQLMDGRVKTYELDNLEVTDVTSSVPED